MRTKRLISLILSCVMMLSCLLAFASCGSTDNNNGEDNDSSKNTADTDSKDTDNNNNDSSTDGTTADTENKNPTANPYDAYAGKYLVYGYKTASQELDYFQVSISVHKNSYLELHNDGKVTGIISGKEIPDGNSWSVDKMIFTNPEGELSQLSMCPFGLFFTSMYICYQVLRNICFISCSFHLVLFFSFFFGPQHSFWDDSSPNRD